MRASVYLIRSGNRDTGFWFFPSYYNYRKHAVQAMREYLSNYTSSKTIKPKLKVVKFVAEEL